MSLWRFALASVQGTGHVAQDLPCQDACHCCVLGSEEEPVLVAVAADGAGSAIHGGDGAALACALFPQEVAALIETKGSARHIDRAFIDRWLAFFLLHVERRAQEANSSARQFACTFLAAVIGVDYTAFVQVGDGAIVLSRLEEPDGYHCQFWPDQGEYANETVFLTSPCVGERLAFEAVPCRIDEVALLTDGLQRLALDYQAQDAHDPFFRPIFRKVRDSLPEDVEALSSALEAFLGSPAVCARTDDDKTLILATRRGSGDTTG